MNCRLCDLIKKVEKPASTTKWSRELNVTIEDDINQTDTLKLTGIQVNNEVIRYEDSDYLGVNILESKKYSDDIIILMPKKHESNQELNWTEFIKIACTIIDTEYHGHAQIIINYGNRFASVPDHAHAHIIQTAKTGFYVPPLRKKY